MRAVDYGSCARLCDYFGRLLVLTLTLMLCSPSGVAEAAPEARIEFRNVAYCNVKMDNVHKSSKVDGDVSARVGVKCYRWNTFDNFFVEEMKFESSIGFFDPVALSGGTVGTCPTEVKRNLAFWDHPCHVKAVGKGTYFGRSTVTVTVGGETDSVDVDKLADLNPGGVA